VELVGIPDVAESNLFFVQTYLNRSRPFFSDFRVSQAMSYAIDRDALCEAIYLGYCDPTFKLFPDDYWAGSPDIPDDYYTYDPEKAKQLLTEAGYEDGFAFELMIPAGSDPYPQFAELLQAQWGAIGITVNINPVDISQLADTYFGQKQSDALLGGGGQVPEPAQLFQGAYMTTSYANPGGITAPGMDDLVNRMFAALDQDERAELVREATKLVVENALNEILIAPQVIYAVNDNVLNWQPNGVANYPIIRGVGVTD
jgi:ABC-type transport system substrate-binding protein